MLQNAVKFRYFEVNVTEGTPHYQKALTARVTAI